MILQKRVKGGILLYALLMLSVFSLLLQFYLRSQTTHHRNHLALKESSRAYLMAELTMDHVAEMLSRMESPKPVEPPSDPSSPSPSGDQPSPSLTPPPPSNSQPQEGEDPPETPDQPVQGLLQFTSGQAEYHQVDEMIHIQVTLQDGKVYQYSFSLSGENP